MKELTSMRQFDAGTLVYDTDAYDFEGWCLNEVRVAGYAIDDLTRLHEIIAYDDLPSLTKHLIARASAPRFQKMTHAFVKEYIEPLLGPDLAVQRYPNFRAVLPSRGEMRLPWHQGIWVGHGWGEATMWVPVTPAFQSNSMYIIDYETSRRLTEQAMRGQWSRARMETEFTRVATALDYRPGHACTFTQGNIHGNMPNETGQTRVSFDFRVLQRGGQFFGKPPGGYFQVPGAPRRPAAKKVVKKDRNIISYCSINTKYTRGIPIPLQRYKIQDYCNEHSIKFRFEHVELIGLNWCPVLNGLLSADKPDDLIFFSIFALPEEQEFKDRILDVALTNNITLHFANENEIMATVDDRARIERTLTFSTDWSQPMDKLWADIAR